MKRFLLAVAAVVLIGATVASAQDPNPVPAQPAKANPFRAGGGPAQPVPVQPGGAAGRVLPVTAARMAVLEEELETLEAQRDIRRGYMLAAEVGVRLSEVNAKRARLLFEKNVATREEVDKAQLEVDAAKAQLEIRAAEMKEIEVKLKYAKKRLDEAKIGGVRPAPNVRPVDPKPIDPPPLAP